MPRYRLTQTQEALGRHDEPKPVETYFDRECHSDDWALGYACSLVNGHPCRIGWRDGSIDIYDQPDDVQIDRPGDAVHIATLERLT